MSALSEACSHRPFANGTEGYTWMENWCDHCAKDHSMHSPSGEGGCDLIARAMMPEFPNDVFPWPEAWLPEPDDGKFQLPSRLTCGAFAPCEDCGGDPHAEIRAEQAAEVGAYWRSR